MEWPPHFPPQLNFSRNTHRCTQRFVSKWCEIWPGWPQVLAITMETKSGSCEPCMFDLSQLCVLQVPQMWNEGWIKEWQCSVQSFVDSSGDLDPFFQIYAVKKYAYNFSLSLRYVWGIITVYMCLDINMNLFSDINGLILAVDCRRHWDWIV